MKQGHRRQAPFLSYGMMPVAVHDEGRYVRRTAWTLVIRTRLCNNFGSGRSNKRVSAMEAARASGLLLNQVSLRVRNILMTFKTTPFWLVSVNTAGRINWTSATSRKLPSAIWEKAFELFPVDFPALKAPPARGLYCIR